MRGGPERVCQAAPFPVHLQPPEGSGPRMHKDRPTSVGAGLTSGSPPDRGGRSGTSGGSQPPRMQRCTSQESPILTMYSRAVTKSSVGGRSSAVACGRGWRHDRNLPLGKVALSLH